VILRASLARTAAFAALYAAATIAGRMTTIGDSRLSMVWPAAGVAVVWFCAQRRSGHRWADVVALTTIVLAANLLTGNGTGLALGVFLTIANLVQTLVFTSLLARRRPTMWGAGGDARLSGGRELGDVLGISVVAAAASAAVGVTGLWLLTDQVNGFTVIGWLGRQATGMFVLGTLGLWFGPAVAGFRARHGSLAGWCRSAYRGVRAASPWRVMEYVAVTVCSVGLYLVAFVFDNGLPLAFPLIAVTVWAAARMSTGFVVAHSVVLGAAAVLFTLQGHGPMATIAEPHLRALVAQAFVLMITVVGLALALGRDERAALIDELAAQKEQAAGQAALNRTIIDSMADGLAVINANGRIMMRNPAAVRLVGPSGARSTSRQIRDRLRNLDGTRIADEDMPHTQALRGESVQSVDLKLLDPDRLDGRIVRVTATALPDGHGDRSAVVLYQDVTAERRRIDELASFAGVVAHDLRTPLTSVEGWTEMAAEAMAMVDSLAAAPSERAAIERARQSLTRVARSSGQMRGLINDLLAHAAAGDAALAPTRVELSEIVAEVARARADAALAGGHAVPCFTMEAHHAVQADPVKIRQLLDNLIGNAVKYTAPGLTPELTITSSRRGDTVEITIADNGIGIPAGQHEAIFDSFHRAHHDSAYAGTGLGLAICQRIVARHGGTISATDNPGGGSRFTFTMPVAPRPAALEAEPTPGASTAGQPPKVLIAA
jgi:signal transduction histidine kinase